ncbi:penicillin-binding protein activator [Rheinheimera sp. 1928-s]|uniref:penicillin-binding protein activator n=1 Tax=Rheinheimera sp. 1928-s TaxID=3033803 RepID=UPI00260A1384|nr:penicillin-binding protein activator [Rheinheimera sp. 1928-s]MDF3124855.1 penicillin-binding protein activator [Rheinheimera sp. 1928-s]
MFPSLYLCIVKSSKLKPLILLGSAIALASCSSTPEQTAPVKRTPVVQPAAEAEDDVEIVKIERPLSGADFIEQASQQQGSEQQWQLLEAAKAHLQQGEIEQALAISRVLAQQATAEVQQANLLPFFQGLIAADDHEDIQKFSNQYSVNSFRATDKTAYLQSLAQYQSSRREPENAVKTYLQLLALQPEQSSYQSALWQQLGMLTPDQLQNLSQSGDNSTQGWAKLLQLHQQHLGNRAALTQAISDWQQQYPNLPSLQQLPDEIQQLSAVDAFSPKTIAVLLPFSSNFRQHAEAIQQGILAASTNQQARLIFIDSQTDTAALQQQLAAEQVDFVIGPLLREQVDAISQKADWTIPTLFLNGKTDLVQQSADKFYFSLSVEDEAHQMAMLFKQKNYKQPVLMASRNPLSQRMAEQFSRDWKQIAGKEPETYWFADQAGMESTIKQLLETAASEQRIRDISKLAGESVKAEPHSRQDIDAIYLLADPAQTRLLKPYIDVSVAPTKVTLPVYASSRSHQKSAEFTDRRDLQGLTFTEMPWMLSTGQQQEFRQQFEQLFPQQDETLQRLFAMGYDAYHLVYRLKQQQQFPALRYQGLTGNLALSTGGQVQRQLTWGKYSKDGLLTPRTP